MAVRGVEMAVASLVRSARTMTRAWPAGSVGSGMKRSGRGKCSEDKEWVWQRVGMGREGQGVRGVDDGQGGGLG